MAGGAPVPGVQLLVKWAGQQVEQTRLLIAHQGQPVLNRERERLLKTIGRSSISFSKLWGLYANHSFSMYNLYNCIFYHKKIWNRRTQMSKCFLFVWPRKREVIMLLLVHGSLIIGENFLWVWIYLMAMLTQENRFKKTLATAYVELD